MVEHKKTKVPMGDDFTSRYGDYGNRCMSYQFKQAIVNGETLALGFRYLFINNTEINLVEMKSQITELQKAVKELQDAVEKIDASLCVYKPGIEHGLMLYAKAEFEKTIEKAIK